MAPKLLKICWLFNIGLLIISCGGDKPQPEPQPTFAEGVILGAVDNSEIKEISGLAASRANPGMFWVHNDSGDKSRIFLLDNQAKTKAEFTIENAKNRDWEDIALANFSDGNYLYVADIGDNESKYEYSYVYRFREPQLGDALAVKNIERFTFRYPDTPHDAECLLIDPQTKDILIVTKDKLGLGKVFRLPYPQSTTAVTTAELISTVAISICTSGIISTDNQGVILKNYAQILYWKRSTNEPLAETFKKEGTPLPYIIEPQGEAIAWATDGSGYYTISEGEAAKLYFYKKK